MLAPPDLQLLIATACSAVLTRVRTKVDEYDEACRKARAKNDEPPRPDLPRASSVRWVAWAAAEIAGAEFAGHGLPAWLRHSDLAAGFEDLAGQHLARLRGWREFTTLATSVIEIRWSRKPIVKKDPLLTETRCGRAKVVPTADRLAWSGEGDAPEFRLELSLPWFLLAEDDEIERGLHDLLASCWPGDRPAIRKPDIVAHASTLARFGVSGVREAHAVFAAQRHPHHERMLRDFGFDVVTGQGSLWEAQPSRQADLRDAVPGGGRLAGKRRIPVGKVESIDDAPEA